MAKPKCLLSRIRRLRWEIGVLEVSIRHHIRSWDDLAKAFVDQYSYLVELALNRETLKAMERKPIESYTEFAQ
ncbi:hypothetical protein COLO4_35499 [Corchorus olitorius]|uniref:Uncharacterized protein n=1 Tax=Corchorus olitorius TaxID=93759 RepID=A0A1R3GGF0_9ROSI|nr:hypothetical protein COLO4_35499 [Corchorus olitorius]